MSREYPSPSVNRVPAFSFVACLVCAIALFALLYPPLRTKLFSMEHQSSDWRSAILCNRTDDVYPDVVIVVFDPNTIATGTTLPIPRDLHAKVIRAIDSARPRVIGLDFYYVQASKPEADREFIDAIKSANAPVVMAAASERADQFKAAQFQYQDAFLSQLGRPVGYLNLRHDDDDVVRFTSIPADNSKYVESFARVVAKLAGANPNTLAALPPRTRIAWLWSAKSKDRPFLIIPAQDVLSGNRQNELRDRVVLTAIDLPYQDEHRTPFSVFTGQPTIGAIIHAQMIAQLLDGRIYSELGDVSRKLFLLTIGVVGGLLSWLLWHRPRNFLNLGAATAALVALDAMCFGLARITLPITVALYVWFVAVTAGYHLRTIVSWASARWPGTGWQPEVKGSERSDARIS
jgi:adenylate cyclase